MAKRAKAGVKKAATKKAAGKTGAVAVKKAPAKKVAAKAVKAGSRVGAKAKAGAGKSAVKAGATTTAGQTAGTTAGKTAAGKTAAGKAAAALPLGMFEVSTGAGATPAELGAALVEHFNAMRPDPELWDRHFHERWESIEGYGAGMGWRGRAAVEAKGKDWTNKHAVHAAKATGPFVGSTGFAVQFEMDVEERATGKRLHMREVGVYTVRDGKVVREEFMYAMS